MTIKYSVDELYALRHGPLSELPLQIPGIKTNNPPQAPNPQQSALPLQQPANNPLLEQPANNPDNTLPHQSSPRAASLAAAAPPAEAAASCMPPASVMQDPAILSAASPKVMMVGMQHHHHLASMERKELDFNDTPPYDTPWNYFGAGPAATGSAPSAGNAPSAVAVGGSGKPSHGNPASGGMQLAPSPNGGHNNHHHGGEEGIAWANDDGAAWDSTGECFTLGDIRQAEAAVEGTGMPLQAYIDRVKNQRRGPPPRNPHPATQTHLPPPIPPQSPLGQLQQQLGQQQQQPTVTVTAGGGSPNDLISSRFKQDIFYDDDCTPPVGESKFMALFERHRNTRLNGNAKPFYPPSYNAGPPPPRANNQRPAKPDSSTKYMNHQLMKVISNLSKDSSGLTDHQRELLLNLAHRLGEVQNLNPPTDSNQQHHP